MRVHGRRREAPRTIEYESRRYVTYPVADFKATHEPIGPAFVAAEGSLVYFPTEGYCLYHLDHQGGPYRLDIQSSAVGLEGREPKLTATAWLMSMPWRCRIRRRYFTSCTVKT
jgi:hypothetical protein